MNKWYFSISNPKKPSSPLYKPHSQTQPHLLHPFHSSKPPTSTPPKYTPSLTEHTISKPSSTSIHPATPLQHPYPHHFPYPFTSPSLSYPTTDKVRISRRDNGVIAAYAAITHNGKREYNEDRVSIIYNIPKPSNYKDTSSHPWPKCSFFGLYDGHGGNGCADYLRNNLHKFIITEPHFPQNPQKAIVNGITKAEKTFLATCEREGDYSGSCAIIIIIIDKRCFIANIGDSRAILSGNNGNKTYALSRDHRPGDEKEYQRILQAGGKIYQTEYGTNTPLLTDMTNIIGPLRVSPGKLSVSRTIGDIEAKLPKYGGNAAVIISTPEIKYFDISDSFDYILIGCDGVYEKMKNKELTDTMWKLIRENEYKDVHDLCGYTVEQVVNVCLRKECSDNLTMIMICFKDMMKLKGIANGNGYHASQTENVESVKVKSVVNCYRTKTKVKQQRQPLSVLLTKLVHNTSASGCCGSFKGKKNATTSVNNGMFIGFNSSSNGANGGASSNNNNNSNSNK